MCVTAPARASESELAPRRLVLVQSRADLERWCHFAADLYACTAFEERKLDATCVASGDRQWRFFATASIKPVVYLWDSRWLGHERLHIGDIQTALRAYMEMLRAHRFDTQTDCRRAAAGDIGGFDKQIDLFVAASNELRHYGYRARNIARR
jgi:hypothetical protein